MIVTLSEGASPSLRVTENTTSQSCIFLSIYIDVAKLSGDLQSSSIPKSGHEPSYSTINMLRCISPPCWFILAYGKDSFLQQPFLSDASKTLAEVENSCFREY